jgi:hypothetical protein
LVGAAAGPALADTPPQEALIAALAATPSSIVSIDVKAPNNAIMSESAVFGDFPRNGSDYLVLSTGLAAMVVGGSREVEASTNFFNKDGVDKHDLTQLTVKMAPPPAASCFVFDFQFLSEEYPDFVGE